jgi:parallel beta-helix repeat protein
VIVAISLFAGPALLAEPVDMSAARQAANAFLAARSAHRAEARTTISAASAERVRLAAAGTREIRGDDGTTLAYVTDLTGGGFVALSADTDIAPVVAYSFRNPFPADGDARNPLYRLLREDMRLRALVLAEHPELKTAETGRMWDSYVRGQADDPSEGTFQQWPPDGTTATGGWLTTAWDQDAPYNQLCPLDPVDGARSVTGCAATALAQLVNYHRRCSSSFSSADAYTTYNGMHFDADSALYDFPSFARLNMYLDAIRAKYSQEADLNDVEIAAVNFACGMATAMDYSSLGSGAAPSDVRDALLGKFGFRSADMFGGLSLDSSHTLQENIINRLPALISICPPDGIGGHMVVCDGYNTNDEYHLNFGWGTNYPEKMTEVWYRLPTDFLSFWAVISDVVLNIEPVKPALEVDPASMSFHSAPGQESAAQALRLTNNVEVVQVDWVASPDGFVVARAGGEFSSRLDPFTIQRTGMGATINVKFQPERAGGYYGTLAIGYSDGNTKYVILKGHSYAGGTSVAAGDVSGVWSRAGSPYFVEGDLQVPQGAELVIEPGVKVFFAGSFSMTVGRSARLTARGTADQPIELTAWNRDVGWTGLRFVNSGSNDLLSYCCLSFARKGAGTIPQGQYTAGLPEAMNGGAIYCSSSNPTIENCKITNNVGDKGGAIYCINSSPVVRNTLIANNTSAGGRPRSGGLCCEEWGLPALWNCTVVNNSPGGVFSTSWQGTDVMNSIVWGNDAYQIFVEECVPTVSFSDVQDGWPGDGNMNVDPCFVDPSAGVGIDFDGSSANWALQTCSPCINAGTRVPESLSTDLAGSSRVHSDVADLGAYENQSDLRLMTVSPSAAHAGFVQVDQESTVQLTIANTGAADFAIEDVTVVDANGVFSLLTPVQGRALSPGDSIEVDVAFRPREEGRYLADVSIRSTADNGAIREIRLRGVGVQGTVVPGPSVSGTWKKAQSPYIITGDISIPRSKTLTIEPGVVVKFAARFRFTVGYRATLRAIGTEQDPILFTASNTETGWFGIRFVNSGADDTLQYCTLEYATKSRYGGTGALDLYGGAILCYSSPYEEPGLPIPSSPMIDSCRIEHNCAYTGGAIMCYAESEAMITNNTIVDNTAEIDGAGIALYYSYCTIANNVIARNWANIVGGGIVNVLGCPAILNNTIAHNRPSAMQLEVTTMFPLILETCSIVNNIVWGNEISISEDINPREYEIQYNDVQGGWPGVGNIDVDPCFADASAGDYHLKSQVGRWDPAAQAWVTDDVTSPCIDAGDPSSDAGDEPEPNGQRINLGADGGTEQASKSPGA